MKKLISLIVSLLFVLNLSSQDKKSTVKKTPVDAKVKTTLNYEYALNDPYNARVYTLKNGLKVYLSVYKNAPRIQTMVSVKAGSKNDPSEATGLAHYLEHMLFKGTDKFGTKNPTKELAEIKKIENLYEVYRVTKDEKERKKIYHQIDSISGIAAKYAIANEYDKMLAAIGAQGTNAYTSFDQTVYINDIPSNQVESWLKIEAERFRKPVLRLFHTELEAVYEEKNRALDSDNDKAFEALFAGLFPKNKYGTQTTIGTIEHLKNPSLKEINKFYNNWYVPNNMAIIMSGDFDPDKVIVQIEKQFGVIPSKPIVEYVPVQEEPITNRIYKEVLGPDPESVNMVWRFNGLSSKDTEIMELISALMINYKAGLMDINLNQAQKVLEPSCWYYPMKDYGVFFMGGSPKQNQKLEDVEEILFSQIELLQKGDFPDWLLNAVITDLKLNKTRELENNYSRAAAMSEAFVNDIKWQTQVDELERISKITKSDIVNFANKNFSKNNYVVVFKKMGEDKSTEKVDKPEITPVEVDRDNVSPFVNSIYNAKTEAIKPVFIDFERDIQKTTLKSSISVLYNKNKENKLFELYYKLNMGSTNDKLLPVAVKFIEFVGTKGMTPAQIKQELFKLGCTFNVFSDTEDTWISLTGLSDNFEEAVKLFEKVLANPIVDDEALANLKQDIKKSREDSKQKKEIILNWGLASYARFGADNPFTYVISNEDLDKLSGNEVVNSIKSILGYEHSVLYYGPMELETITTLLNQVHIAPKDGYKKTPEQHKFNYRELNNEVLVVDFDMKQAEIIMLSNGGEYNESLLPLITLYNAYFGDGMSGVVFQDLRESKALAYSVNSKFIVPNKPSKPFLNKSYIGSQVDKLPEAMKGMSDLLNTLPKSETSFSAAKENVIQEINSARINKSEILFNYLNAMQLNQKTDIRKEIYDKVSTYKFDDINRFQTEYIKDKKTTVLVIGKKENLDYKVLEKYGPVKELSLKEIFGY